jgi:hypothetical protein
MRAICPAHLILLDLIILTIFGCQTRSFLLIATTSTIATGHRVLKSYPPTLDLQFALSKKLHHKFYGLKKRVIVFNKHLVCHDCIF